MTRPKGVPSPCVDLMGFHAEEYTFYYTGVDQLDRVEERTFLTRAEALEHATYLEEHGAQMITVCDSHDRELPR
jgi:hypothetical protein